MPGHPCPQCQQPASRKLDSASQYAIVTYYRCEGCGHVWSVFKDEHETIRHVTEPRFVGRNSGDRAH